MPATITVTSIAQAVEDQVIMNARREPADRYSKRAPAKSAAVDEFLTMSSLLGRK